MLSSEWHLICTFLAVVCSSWTPVNRGSTGRSIMTPLGCEDYPHVRKSNKLTSRTRIFFKAHKFHHEFINFYSIKKAVTNYKMYLFLVDPTLGTYMIEFMHDHYIYISCRQTIVILVFRRTRTIPEFPPLFLPGSFKNLVFALYRSVILMWMTVLMGGSYFLENPHNSLVACHPRYVWMLERLREFNLFVPWMVIGIELLKE